VLTNGQVTASLYLADCQEVLPTLEDNSVSLVATDPPYFQVKEEGWDRQWDSVEGFLAWLDDSAAQWHRILASNGSLYVFASPQMAAWVEVLIGKRFNVLNHIVWAKDLDGRGSGKHRHTEKEALRSYFPQTERIVFAEHYGADNIAKGEAGYVAQCDELRGFVFEPLRAYLDGERIRAGLSPKQVGEILGTQMYGHYFTQTQWTLPVEAAYLRMREGFQRAGGGGDYLRREYEDLRREYEGLRRPFSVTVDVPYTDVWTFKSVQSYPDKHPCEKPLPMMLHIVGASSKPGGLVADPFMGSGTTGVACVQTGRSFIGIELDASYYAIALRRIRDALAQPRLDMPEAGRGKVVADTERMF
jgi:adenine-specific DNA-methyltransferase